jgi:hypothetical protein
MTILCKRAQREAIGVKEKGRKKVIQFGPEVALSLGSELVEVGREVICLGKRLGGDNGRKRQQKRPGR